MFDFGRIAQSVDTVGYLLAAVSVAPLFPFLYLVMRWRSADRDSLGIGTYGMLLYFGTVSFLLLVAGAANLSYGWISTTEIRPFLRRLSWGVFFGGALSLGLHLLLVRLVPLRASWPDARRIFGGFLMTVAGMVALTSLVMLLITVFHDVAPDDAKAIEMRFDDLKLWGSWSLYFLVTYVGCVLTMTAPFRRRG